MKLILADKGAEIIYGLDGQNRLAYQFEGGVLNQIDDQFNKDILNGKLIEVTHTHPWFGLNIANPSPADREAFSFWESYNKRAIYKIIYSPSIDNNASKEEIEAFLQNSKDLKILTSVFIPQFAD
jgi:hypothetical protein